MIRLTRPPNSITAAVAVISALFLALGENGTPYDLTTYLLIGSAAFFVTAHAMVHNDIVDYDADCISTPFRPLPSKMLSMKEAKIWATILFAAAITSGILIDLRLDLKIPISLFWAISNALLLDAYNLWFKKSGLIGNMVVAYVVWALFIYADLLISDGLTLRVQSIGLYAFFMNWGREVIKGIRDIEGDRSEGVLTIAVRWGAHGAAYVGTGLLFIAILWTIPLILNPVGNFVIPVILIMFNLVIIFRCYNLIKNPTAKYANSTKRLFLYLMLIAVILLLINQIIVLNFN